MLEVTTTRAQAVLDDAPEDAKRLDSTPFTPEGLGTALGTMLAMIAALAQCIIELTSEVEDLSRQAESIGLGTGS